VCIGRLAGSGITSVDNNIIIGHNSGVHPDPGFGQISDRCFIDNIHGAPVSSNFDPQFVMVDSAGRLGTFPLDGPDPGGFSPKRGIRPQAIPDAAKQAMLNRKVETLEATVAELGAQLKEQAAQIQKVSAQLELNNSATRTVASDHQSATAALICVRRSSGANAFPPQKLSNRDGAIASTRGACAHQRIKR
jgi:Tfp pilus assembly protein FimV